MTLVEKNNNNRFPVHLKFKELMKSIHNSQEKIEYNAVTKYVIYNAKDLSKKCICKLMTFS